MNKTNNDISSLFKHLGTSPEHYQEIGRSNEARESEARWPLLASIHGSGAEAPAVVPAVTVAPSRQPVQTATPAVAPLAAAAPHAPVASVAEATVSRQQAVTAPARQAEFIAPRPKSLVSIESRRDGSWTSYDEPAPRAAEQAPLAPEPAKSDAPIERVFARLAKPKVAAGARHPAAPMSSAPEASQSKPSLFERLRRK